MARKRHTAGGPPGFRRGPRIADLMTPEYRHFFSSSQAAERAGDAETALAYHRGIPMFRRSAHVARLAQLAGLTGEMEPWMWARWAAYQCTRAEDPGSDSKKIQRTALDYTLGILHADVLAERAARDVATSHSSRGCAGRTGRSIGLRLRARRPVRVHELLVHGSLA